MDPPSAAAEPPPPPPPPQHPRSSFSCDRHPEEQFTGFCPECLCERLAGLDKTSSSAAPRKSNAGGNTSSAAAAAIKAIFRGGGDRGSNRNSNSSRPSSSFFAELRRTQSFSASKGEGLSGVFEPQRKSCDVRGRNTLWSLFSQDDARKKETRAADAEADPRNIASSSVGGPVPESREEAGDEAMDDGEDENDGIKSNVVSPVFEDDIEEIVEEGVEAPEAAEEEELKTMKDHIDLDSHCKRPAGRDFKEIAGSFLSAASVFSKKLQKWRRKQKLKKQGNGSASAFLPVQKRHCRETQSEIADYGYGRRSCDTDPRFSLDAGRMSLDAGRMSIDAARASFDDPRCSFDEPRASWEGCLNSRAFPRLQPMVSVVEVEDAPVNVSRTDGQNSVEAPVNCAGDEEGVIPGGCAQTRDYYSDTSSRRRKSLDRSSSIRRTAAAVVAEMDELKPASNAKVSPTTADYAAADRELRDSNSNSLRDDCSESFDLGFRDAAAAEAAMRNGKPPSKKSRRWKVWNIWGLIYRRGGGGGGGKDEDEDRFRRLNGVERSFSESWRGNGEVRGGFRPGVFRSNSSVSSRNLYAIGCGGGPIGGVRRSSLEANGHGRKRKDECGLERNRSARFSPNNIETGLLRFYLTPLRGSRSKGRQNHSHSIARSVLRLY